jgi:thiol-disulfide isomerase/thioredoxin
MKTTMSDETTSLDSPQPHLDAAAAPAHAARISNNVAAASGLLVLGLLVSIILTPSKPTTAGVPEAMSIGALAPNFTLQRLEGGSAQLSSYRGVKPVWVNFWATWCPHCQVEMPQMQEFYKQYHDQGLEILGVDDQEPSQLVQPYISKGGYTWSFLLDLDGKITRQYRITGLPTHVFIGRDGVIQNIVVGSITRPQMDAAVTKLMGQ